MFRHERIEIERFGNSAAVDILSATWIELVTSSLNMCLILESDVDRSHSA
jgi:hypothetical protein